MADTDSLNIEILKTIENTIKAGVFSKQVSSGNVSVTYLSPESLLRIQKELKQRQVEETYGMWGYISFED